jgi:hypothetical protein
VPTSPALVYLASLPSPSSRRVQERCLETIARLALGVDMAAPGACYATIPWHHLCTEHTTALRARLAELYPAPTANRHLAALRRVLKEAWRRCSL